MDDRDRDRQHLAHFRGGKSPITQILALGFYDGPTNGLLRCGEDGRVYRFDLLDDDLEQDIRIFGLAPLDSNAMTRLVEALSPYQESRWPVWVPRWEFPKEAIRSALDNLTDQILNGAGPPEFAIATSDLVKEILLAKEITVEDLASVADWFSFMGLAKAPAGI
jgi:hypothetical protein